VKPGIPFVWLRRDPSSGGAIVETIPANGQVRAVSGQNAGQTFDGAQWWGYVAGGRAEGWVELNSLQLAPNPATATPSASVQTWRANTVVRVRASVPFAWIRADLNGDSPSPDAAPAAGILATVNAGTELVIVAGPHLARQTWWQVRDPNSTTVGFVEETALEYVRARPNFALTPIPPSAWRSYFTLRLKSSLPFAWIRSAPNSNAGIVYTVQRGGSVELLTTDVQNDGVQNWRQVGFGNAPVRGWIEENALEFDRIWTRF
jgi:hypothetical protein